MRAHPALLALLFCAALPRPVTAAYMTGDELSARCLSDEAKDVSACFGYVAGVIDYHLLLQSLGTSPSVEFCLPEGLSVQDAALTVIQNMKRAPLNHPFIASPAVAMALNESFPCQKQGRKRRR